MSQTEESLERDEYFNSLWGSVEDIELFLKVDGEETRNVPADLGQRLLADLSALRSFILLTFLRSDPETYVEMPDGRFALRERLAELKGPMQ